ncbi:hypothetical protein F0224_11340 [Vibrio coralliilyticus]|uniref:hypothetical protein n=1 Tax=Vibrio TaxID=662 RepID=UPI000BAC267C|nr:hypothetical protein [Vibrio cholerae]EGQ9230982.1 hypothetical protein [Vibrio alginolyticus]NOI76276.1 hypothetical protein [Vibrio coralliilyticus]PAW03751.1 hypothetical protein CKJ79_10920 [Vibrio coralliilyticus]SNC56809.1 Uncharacterised protein [Vibrio cholerae]
MKKIKNNVLAVLGLSSLLSAVAPVHGMGLRSLVALPVEKDGAVVRFVYEHSQDVDTNVLSANVAYGLSANQTLLLGLPYRLSPGGTDQQGDLSILYRHILWQQDRRSGTSRLGLLGGAIIPTENGRDGAFQTGFVFTHFQSRNEFDVDAVYQAGIEDRPASGRYDVSWQYRLSPANRPDWGILPELNSVLELNSRWQENDGTVHQITAGLQWVHQQWVIEGGIVQDLNATKDRHYLLSARFHF